MKRSPHECGIIVGKLRRSRARIITNQTSHDYVDSLPHMVQVREEIREKLTSMVQ